MEDTKQVKEKIALLKPNKKGDTMLKSIKEYKENDNNDDNDDNDDDDSDDDSEIMNTSSQFNDSSYLIEKDFKKTKKPDKSLKITNNGVNKKSNWIIEKERRKEFFNDI